MPATKTPPHLHALSVEEPAAPSRRPFLKVYLPAEEKAAFAAEAAQHRQDASEYARFILSARTDPLLFLQLARLLHPGFAAGMMGNPSDVGRLAELEKQVLTLTHERDEAARARDVAEGMNDSLERQLAESRATQQRLAAHVADLARVAAHNRERAMEAGAEVEAVPRDLLLIVKALSVAPALHKKDLEEALTAEGLTEQEAREAVIGAERDDLITRGKDRKYRLARPPAEGDEE